jgi:hypothetical protein
LMARQPSVSTFEGGKKAHAPVKRIALIVSTMPSTLDARSRLCASTCKLSSLLTRPIVLVGTCVEPIQSQINSMLRRASRARRRLD